MQLYERDVAFATLENVLDLALDGEGWLVTVTGEVGIGKSSLVKAFAEAQRGRARFLTTACDHLLTPRPLGPLHDLARTFGAPLDTLLSADTPPARLFPATAAELAGRLRPAVLVVEDLHWADSATLDWLSYLARRLDQVAVMLVLTFRDDERGVVSELGRVLASAPHGRTERIHLGALSSDAAEAILGSADRVDEVMRVTGGNPLFLTALADAGDAELPQTVRDTVLGRMAGLNDTARGVIEVVAAVPGRCEWWLLESITDDWSRSSDAALASGLLTDDPVGLAFRHEVVRQAVEANQSEARRRAIHGRILEALEAATESDPARLAHHARQAGRTHEVLRYATAAAEVAIRTGAHRQAVEQYRAAILHAGGLQPSERAELLVAFADEAQVCNLVEDAIDAREQALELWVQLGRRDDVGETLAALARLYWWAGRRKDAEQAARDAIVELEPRAASTSLSTAYGCLADILMAVGEHDEAARCSQRALALAEDAGDSGALAATLSDTGAGQLFVDTARGESLLHRAFDLADSAGNAQIAGRAASILAMGCLYDRRYEAAGQRLEAALAYARTHELPAHEAASLGLRSRWHLDLGRWDAAERDARDMLGAGDQAGVSLCPALVTLGLLHARRGEPEATEVLDDAWERALHTGDLQRLAPTAAARAEHAWLNGDLDAVARATGSAYELARAVGEPWATGELGWWLCVSGQRPDVAVAAEPFALLVAGDWQGAATAWHRRGLPYERALALAFAPDPETVLEALAAVDALGATAAVRVVRQRLRDLGVRSIPRGPQRATRRNPAGLTRRQQDVLGLLAEGRTNNQIADELVISVRTVDHHVSTILRKLGVSSRDEAAAWLAAQRA